MDPVALAQALIRAPSITPDHAGALDIVAEAAVPLGFTCHRLRFGEVDNLVAVRAGRGARLAFAGHVDVVPPGEPTAWAAPPFAAALEAGTLIGRGAVDMKGAIAAFLSAAARRHAAGADDNLMLILTSDEEGEAIDGTARLMPWIAEQGLTPAATIVGEPTAGERVGDTVKHGRRGSINLWLTVLGQQGHVAYPARADNPIRRLARIIARLSDAPLDEGYPGFEPSNLAVTRIEAGDPRATNLIPAQASARMAIRFNPRHRGEELRRWVETIVAQEAPAYRLEHRVSGEAFLTEPGPLKDVVSAAVLAVTGAEPQYTTGGGTSDARFIAPHCPVLELGLVGATMHQVDEQVPVADLVSLTDIYAAILARWSARAAD